MSGNPCVVDSDVFIVPHEGGSSSSSSNGNGSGIKHLSSDAGHHDRIMDFPVMEEQDNKVAVCEDCWLCGM